MTKLADLWKIDPEYGYPDLNQATVGDLVKVLADPEIQKMLGADSLVINKKWGIRWVAGWLHPGEYLVVPLSRLEDTE